MGSWQSVSRDEMAPATYTLFDLQGGVFVCGYTG